MTSFVAPEPEHPAPAAESRPAAALDARADGPGVLTSGFAHDLNNLLTGILGSVARVRAALLAEEPTESYLEQIEIAAQCAGELCQKVLAQAGHGAVVSEPVHLSQLVAQSLPLVHLALGGRARLTLQLVDALPLVVGDATQLRQVLLNLVTNGAEAIRAAAGGELTIATRVVELDAEALRTAYAAADAAPGRHVALQVRDNGAGILPEVRDRVFEPFFSTKPSASPTSRGLGLAIVLGVVRAHRGVLQVHSAVGQGTDFVLLFPAPAEPVAPVPSPPSVAPPVLAPRSAASDHIILVIDDDRTVREFTARVLRTAGYRVIAVSSGPEALAQLGAAGARISLVLLDWALGSGDAEQLARQLHSQRPAAPLVILSGYGPTEYANRLHGIPIAGTLQKPFRLDTLLDLVRRILR